MEGDDELNHVREEERRLGRGCVVLETLRDMKEISRMLAEEVGGALD